MRRTRFDHNVCPVARTSDLLGDWWTPLVLRELLLGNRRFARIQDRPAEEIAHATTANTRRLFRLGAAAP